MKSLLLSLAFTAAASASGLLQPSPTAPETVAGPILLPAVEIRAERPTPYRITLPAVTITAEPTYDLALPEVTVLASAAHP